MANEFTVGTRRVADLIDFDPDTPNVNVTLERSENGISVTVPWSEPDSPYARWFMAGGESTRGTTGHGSPRAPRRVLFHDSHGSVLLIRCRADGFHSDAFGPGSGTLRVRAAIMGVGQDVEFDCPHGLQTEISGLRALAGRDFLRHEARPERRNPDGVSDVTAHASH